MSSSQCRVGVIQSSYFPWKGYFDIIHDVDVFIFHDDVKYTKGDWRNRNQIKLGESLKWITIPVGKQAEKQRICDVLITNKQWQRAHWRLLQQAYSRCAYFDQYAAYFEDLYCRKRWTSLDELNQTLTRQLCEWLGIEVSFMDSRRFELKGAKQERLLELLEKAGATFYLSGPAAQAYIDPAAFAARNIDLEFKTYQYPEYPQGNGPFFHNVSIVDLLFRFGSDCTQYIWGKAAVERRLSEQASL